MSDFDEREMLTRELRERSLDVGGHPVGLDAVQRSARRMHRRRQVVGGAVAAVVASIAVPTGLAATGGLTATEGPNRPHVASSPTADPRPAGTRRLSFDGLPRGADPEVDYLQGEALVRSDGRVLRLEKAYQEIAPVESGWVGLAETNGEYTRDYIDSTGHVTSSLPSTNGLAVSLDGSRIAYTQVENGRWNVVDVTADGREPRSPLNPGDHEVRAVGYVGQDVLVYNSQDGRGQVQARVLEPSADDYEVPAKPRLWGAVSTSEATGLVAGQEVADGNACWRVVGYRTGHTEFRTCDVKLESFSPDGRFILGASAETDGAGARDLVVLDARTGDVVVRFEQPRDGQLYLGEAVWEDDEHVLAPVTDGLKTEIVRFGLDGSMETASGVVRSPDYFLPSPIRFSARP